MSVVQLNGQAFLKVCPINADGSLFIDHLIFMGQSNRVGQTKATRSSALKRGEPCDWACVAAACIRQVEMK